MPLLLPSLSGRECVRILYRFGFRVGKLSDGRVRMEGPFDRTVDVPLVAPIPGDVLERIVTTAAIPVGEFNDLARKRFPHAFSGTPPESEPSVGAGPASPREPFTGPRTLEGTRVLLVEDDPDTLDLLKYMMGEHGADVREATSAAAGLTILNRWRPDVIVSDIGLPHVNGYEFLAQARRVLGEEERVPAIALTAWAGPTDQKKATEAGFARHLAKPVQLEELILAIASVVDDVID